MMMESCIYADIIWTLLIGLPFLILYWYINSCIKSFKNLPPGPWGLPFFGYVFCLGKKPQLTLTNLGKKYGDIYSINLGTETVTVLSSYKVMKETLVNEAENFYPNKYCHVKNLYFSAQKMIELQTDGGQYLSTVFRDFQKEILEAQITNEIKHLIKSLEQHTKFDLLEKSVINSMYAIFTGSHFEYGDETLEKIVDLLHKIRETNKLPTWDKALPIVMQKFFNKNYVAKDHRFDFAELVSNIVDRCEKEYKSGSQNNSICNVWFREVEKQGIKVSFFMHKLVLKRYLSTLFTEDAIKTSSTLLWAFWYLIKYPEVQTKIQNEIGQVISKDRLPTMDDMKLMPYTEATIMEILRLHPFTILNLLNNTIVDTTVRGKLLPKGSCVIPNVWAVHTDPCIFPDPDKFKPERFLTNRQEIIRREEFIPFSLGKLKGVGEPIAMIKLFLYLTSLLQNFTFKREPGMNLILDNDSILSLTSKIFKPQAVKR